jgi:hypothetical protein
VEVALGAGAVERVGELLRRRPAALDQLDLQVRDGEPDVVEGKDRHGASSSWLTTQPG